MTGRNMVNAMKTKNTPLARSSPKYKRDFPEGTLLVAVWKLPGKSLTPLETLVIPYRTLGLQVQVEPIHVHWKKNQTKPSYKILSKDDRQQWKSIWKNSGKHIFSTKTKAWSIFTSQKQTSIFEYAAISTHPKTSNEWYQWHSSFIQTMLNLRICINNQWASKYRKLTQHTRHDYKLTKQ